MVRTRVGSRPHYQGQDVQQPRPEPLQVKGRAVGQRHDGSCGRRVGVSAAGQGPIGKLRLGAGRAGPGRGRSPQRSQHCPSGRRASRQAGAGQRPPRGCSRAAQIPGCTWGRERTRRGEGEGQPARGTRAGRRRPGAAAPGPAPPPPPRGAHVARRGPRSPRRCRRRSPTGQRRPRSPRPACPDRESAGGRRGTPRKPSGPRRA